MDMLSTPSAPTPSAPTPSAPTPSAPTSPARIDTYLRTEHLSLYYGSEPAFQDVTLSFPKGRITALIGPSGCGKTSFLNCLNRLTDLIPHCRISGRILLEGTDVLHPNTDIIALRRRVGLIFQKPNPFPFSIWKNIAFPLKEHGVKNTQQIGEIVERVLIDVGLWDEVKDRLKSSALHLSGGQKQRLCIARTLALHPEILLMDEPCSALDPISTGVLEDTIARLRDRYTILLVTHNLAQARRVADYVALFWVKEGSGRLIEADFADRLFKAPQHPITSAYINGHRG